LNPNPLKPWLSWIVREIGPGTPEVEDAKKRLAGLREMADK